MGDTFKLRGDLSTGPSCGGAPSGFPNVVMSIDESMALAGPPVVGQYDLSTDSPASVSLGGLSGANVVVIKAIGGKVRARLTSADGTSQAVAVDTFAVILSESVPYTALDLTRVASTPTTVKVLLGQTA